MEAMQGQVQAVIEELTAVKAEIIQLKASHANMHQSGVENNAQAAARYAEQAMKVADIEKKIEGIGGPTGVSNKRSLIEPKQVAVEIFSGSIADSRSKFLEWGERIKDRAHYSMTTSMTP